MINYRAKAAHWRNTYDPRELAIIMKTYSIRRAARRYFLMPEPLRQCDQRLRHWLNLCKVTHVITARPWCLEITDQEKHLRRRLPKLFKPEPACLFVFAIDQRRFDELISVLNWRVRKAGGGWRHGSD